MPVAEYDGLSQTGHLALEGPGNKGSGFFVELSSVRIRDLNLQHARDPRVSHSADPRAEPRGMSLGRTYRRMEIGRRPVSESPS